MSDQAVTPIQPFHLHEVRNDLGLHLSHHVVTRGVQGQEKIPERYYAAIYDSPLLMSAFLRNPTLIIKAIENKALLSILKASPALLKFLMTDTKLFLRIFRNEKVISAIQKHPQLITDILKNENLTMKQLAKTLTSISKSSDVFESQAPLPAKHTFKFYEGTPKQYIPLVKTTPVVQEPLVSNVPLSTPRSFVLPAPAGVQAPIQENISFGFQANGKTLPPQELRRATYYYYHDPSILAHLASMAVITSKGKPKKLNDDYEETHRIDGGYSVEEAETVHEISDIEPGKKVTDYKVS